VYPKYVDSDWTLTSGEMKCSNVRGYMIIQPSWVPIMPTSNMKPTIIIPNIGQWQFMTRGKADVQSGSFRDLRLTNKRPDKIRNDSVNMVVVMAITAGCREGGFTKFGGRPSGATPAGMRHKSTPGSRSWVVVR
jgi:hypothetical protein